MPHCHGVITDNDWKLLGNGSWMLACWLGVGMLEWLWRLLP